MPVPDTRFRAYHGGAWNLEDARWCRPAFRDKDDPATTDPRMGFRTFRRMREVRR